MLVLFSIINTKNPEMCAILFSHVIVDLLMLFVMSFHERMDLIHLKMLWEQHFHYIKCMILLRKLT